MRGSETGKMRGSETGMYPELRNEAKHIGITEGRRLEQIFRN